jgi:2-oxoglutarate ferredoxin oxidoreductase subunit beta
VEIYQNCNIFNDGAFEALKDSATAQEAVIRLEQGEPIRFGAPAEDGLGSKGVVRDPATGELSVVDVTEAGTDRILVHDAHTPNPAAAFALSRLADPDTLHHTPIGVLRNVTRPVYDADMADQLDRAVSLQGEGDLAGLLAGTDTWTVS